MGRQGSGLFSIDLSQPIASALLPVDVRLAQAEMGVSQIELRSLLTNGLVPGESPCKKSLQNKLVPALSRGFSLTAAWRLRKLKPSDEEDWASKTN